jgi:GPH family glycoside/pentoside/hexuronide:cation symporter
MGAAGYIQATTQNAVTPQPDSALAAIRALAGPLPAVFFILGIVLVSFYPISREKHARIVRAIEKRRERRESFKSNQANRD